MVKFLFDLDGTITKQETLPIIASHFRIENRINQLTKETVAGNVPFIESFIRRVHILSDFPVDEVAELLSQVEFYPKIVEFIQLHDIACHVVTGNLSCWISLMMQRIGCTYFASEALVKDNHIEKLVSILRKEDIVKKFQEEGHRVVFIGDGNNDVEAMRHADVSIASSLTHEPTASVLSVTDYWVLNEVSLCRQLNQLL